MLLGFLDCGDGLYGADGYYNESDVDPDCGHWSGNALIIFNDNIQCVDAVALDVPHPCTKSEYDRIIAEAAQRYKEYRTAVRV